MPRGRDDALLGSQAPRQSAYRELRRLGSAWDLDGHDSTRGDARLQGGIFGECGSSPLLHIGHLCGKRMTCGSAAKSGTHRGRGHRRHIGASGADRLCLRASCGIRGSFHAYCLALPRKQRHGYYALMVRSVVIWPENRGIHRHQGSALHARHRRLFDGNLITIRKNMLCRRRVFWCTFPLLSAQILRRLRKSRSGRLYLYVYAFLEPNPSLETKNRLKTGGRCDIMGWLWR